MDYKGVKDMFKKGRILLLSILSAVSFASVAVASLAWFSVETAIPDINIDGTSASAYFAYGDGSSSAPFGIKTPRQLYNLAWLQYNGMFNKDANSDGVIDKQFYFELANDLDMTGWELPPIGTEDNPFLGNFDGNSHVISNLTVSNQATFDRKPTAIDYNVQPEIVGFFGVVGDGAKDIDYSYTSSINQLTDFTLNNLTVESKTSQTLIGLAAGYVNGDMSGVRIDGSATLDVNGQTSTAISSITSKLSDYGLVGYTTKTGTSGSYSQKLSEYFANYDSTEEESDNWGNSIDMLSLYNRLSHVYNADSYDNGNFTVETITSADGTVNKKKVENLNNHYAGLYDADYSYTFNKHYQGNQDFYYLYDEYSPVSGTMTENSYSRSSIDVTNNQLRISQTSSGYLIQTGTYYVKLPTLSSAGNTTELLSTNSSSDATIFTKEANGTGYRYYAYQTINGNNTKVYVGYRTYSTSTSVNLTAIAYNVNGTNIKKYSTWYTDNTGMYHYRHSSSDTSKKSYLCRNSSGKIVSYYNGITGSKGVETTLSITSYLSAALNGNCYTTANSSEALVWYFENSKIFTCEDNLIYYLCFDGSKLFTKHLIPVSQATSFAFSNGVLSFTYSGSTYYLNLSNSSLYSTSQTSNTVMENLGAGSLSDQEYVNSSSQQATSIPVNSFKPTYIPLSVSKNDIYTTLARNNGYIMSGSTYVPSNYSGQAESAYYNAGDVRVSRYDMSKINVAFGQDTFDNSKLFAITATSNSDYALITDSHNASSTAGSGLSTITDRKASTSLSRYDDWDTNTGAREALGTVFTEDSSNIYGLHFMNASISASNYVTVPGAKISGTTYSSGLKMPKDCIDFNVKEAGYITFFAGTYFSVGYSDENNSFFSLHKINRDSNNDISSITEIQTIYKDSANNYYYNPSSTTGLTKLFDTAVLTNPSKFINNAVYYFEIPVSAGEYALGSVSGKNGAYLMYLDISASGDDVIQDKIDAHFITTIANSNSFPYGVDFVPITISGNGGDTIAFSIDSSSKGVLVLVVSANDISVTDTSSIAEYVFRNTNNYAASSPGSGQFTCDLPGAPPTVSSGGTRVLTMNLETASGNDCVVKITDSLNLNGTIASSTYEVDSGSGFVTKTESYVRGLTTEVDIDDLRALVIVATLTRSSGTAEFVTTYDTENCSYEDKIVDVDIDKNGTSISIAVTSGYTFKIGGTPYANGSSY